VTLERLAHARRPILDETNLHGLVAIGRLALGLDDDARAA
jgi:hypothetical protein